MLCGTAQKMRESMDLAEPWQWSASSGTRLAMFLSPASCRRSLLSRSHLQPDTIMTTTVGDHKATRRGLRTRRKEEEETRRREKQKPG